MSSLTLQVPLFSAEAAGRTFVRGKGNIVAVQAATFQLLQGETIAIVGRSGSGKSTLLHIIAGLDVPSFGAVDWPALGAREQLRPGKVGMMFQSPSLVPSLDVAENVMLPLALLDVPGNTLDQAIRELARFGIADLAHKLPEELSGGQAQRVSLARALVARPRLVVADEPTGQLDHASGTALIEALLTWTAEANATLVIATHDLEIASRMKRSWQMDHGALALDNEIATK